MVQPEPTIGAMATFKTLKDNVPRERARALRRDDTNAEARLWNALRARRLGGWKWRRQVPTGPFILDFCCVEAGLVVELDGGKHSEQVAYDARRTEYLERLGLRVIRFWNSDVLTNRDGVCLTILDACGGEHPSVGPG
jgi:very-short-patch-repair endonuclease